MAVMFIVLFVILVIAVSRKKPQKLVYASLNKSAKRLYTTIYGGGIGDRPRLLTDREISLWVRSRPVQKLNQVRGYLRSEIIKLQPADWHGRMFSAIVDRSTNLYYFLDENGRTTVHSAQDRELEGISDALKGVVRTRCQYPYTLRTMFHDMFHNVILGTQRDDHYYAYGQFKVINLLRSYQASVGLCMCMSEEGGNSEWEQLPVLSRIAMYYKWLERQRENSWVDIHRGFPVIEFDLARIRYAGVFEYEGSLLNCLFLHIVSMMTTLIDSEPHYRSFSETTHDMRVACFSYEFGEVYVVKYTGITDTFANRLYIEFANIPPRDPLYSRLLSMKLHIEQNS